jgi:hypothetical protein
LLATLGLSASAAVPPLAVNFDNTPGVSVSGPNADIGWEFSITSPISVIQLGFWDEGGNGLSEQHPIVLGPGITMIEKRFGGGPVVPFQRPDGTATGAGIFGPNFAFLAVPEPSSMALAIGLASLAGLGAWRRKRSPKFSEDNHRAYPQAFHASGPRNDNGFESGLVLGRKIAGFRFNRGSSAERGSMSLIAYYYRTQVGTAHAALGLAVFALFASPALAQYHVSGGIGQFDDGGSGNSIPRGAYDRQGAIQQGGGVTYDQNGDTANQIAALHSQANSLGDITGLHAHAYAQVIKPFQTFADTDPNQHRFGIFATGNVIGDYSVTVSNPNVAPGTPVSTFFTVHLHGETIQGASNTPDTINMSRADAGAQATARGIVDGIYGTPGGGAFNRQVDNGTAEPQNGSGSLINFVNDLDFSTEPFVVMNDQPFTVEMFLQASATAIGDYRESFTAEANSDFGSTLTFATDRPVFDLPSGYTANSLDGGIVNNTFVAVPEPGCLALAGMALVILALRFRRHDRAPTPGE